MSDIATLERRFDGVSLPSEYEIVATIDDMMIHVVRDHVRIASVTQQEIMPFNSRLPIEQRIAMALAVRRAGGREAVAQIASHLMLPNN